MRHATGRDQGHHDHQGLRVTDKRRPRPESAAVFTVAVTTHYGEAVPNGEKVTVTVGSTSCIATLTAGNGTCTITNSALKAGSYAVSATLQR